MVVVLLYGLRKLLLTPALPKLALPTVATTTMEPNGAFLRDGTSRLAWYSLFAVHVALLQTETLALNLTCLRCLHDQVTLPGQGQSFAWMYSIEDPAGDSKFRGCGAQVQSLRAKTFT